MLYPSLSFRNSESGLLLSITTTASPQTFTLPMNPAGTYSANIDWGDGSTNEITAYNDADLAHSYASAGSYTIVLSGVIGGIYFNNGGNKSLVTSVDYKNATYIERAFFGCSNLQSFSGQTSGITSFYYTWYGCSSLTSFPLIDTSSGTGFSLAWYGCSGLTSFPLIDTSSGTSFYAAWRGCSSLTSFPAIDTSNSTNFADAWFGCSSLTSFPAIDTSNSTTFDAAWFGCSSLTSFPLIDTSNCTNFRYAWYGCSSLTSFPAGFFDSWTGTPANNCFFNTWNGCISLTPQSVENILVSIDTSGQSAPASGVEITISYNGTGLTAATTTAITNLKGKGWAIKINGVLQ